MLKPKPPQASFYGSYLYDRIIPQDHLLRKINQAVDFSFVNDLVKDMIEYKEKQTIIIQLIRDEAPTLMA